MHDYELLDRIELRRMRTESGRFSLPSASGGFGGASPAVDLDLLDPLSLGHFIPPSPTSPQTPHSPPFILKFSQDTCSNIYLATFSQRLEQIYQRAVLNTHIPTDNPFFPLAIVRKRTSFLVS